MYDLPCRFNVKMGRVHQILALALGIVIFPLVVILSLAKPHRIQVWLDYMSASLYHPAPSPLCIRWARRALADRRLPDSIIYEIVKGDPVTAEETKLIKERRQHDRKA